ncbi:TPA: hypothetical protein HA241_04345, partial [Candidatus Woesearchaeota archaeon]|nr:hypothetical protein [Candidatus Woesearchaeota archaeon]
NIGTIPEESYVTVKIGEQAVGKIDEGFLERLRPGDVFVLGGNVYMFKFSRGMVAQVSTSVNRPPTVPSWFSEMLPLSFDLAMEISRFRKLMDERFREKKSQQEIITFIHDFLSVDDNAAESIYHYFYEQFQYSIIPSDKKIVVETYTDRGRTYVLFDCVFGRRVNDCLSRSLAYVIGTGQHRDVEIGLSDNGFYLSAEKTFNPLTAFETLKKDDFRGILEKAVDRSEVLNRRFRHCAARSLMILREYMGRRKNVGRMQVGSKILMNAVKKISMNFPILKEARREVLEDLMDYEHAQEIITGVVEGKIKIEQANTTLPSPFAFSLIMAGYSDVIRVEDKQEFLRRMHQAVMAKIALKEGKKKIAQKQEEFSHAQFWDDVQQKVDDTKDMFKERLKMQVWNLSYVPMYAKEELVKLIETGNMRKEIWEKIKEYRNDIEKNWPEELKEFVLREMDAVES